MTATKAKIGYGSLLKRGDGVGGASTSYTTVAEILDFTALSMSREMIDATNMESPDGYEEFVAGLKSGGEVQLECNFVYSDAQQQGLITDFEAGSNRDWQIILPDTGTTTVTFSALISEIGLPAPVKGVMKLSVKLKVSGKPTVTA